MKGNRVNDSILVWYLEAEGRCRDASGVLNPPSGEADWTLFLVIRTHSSRHDDDPTVPVPAPGPVVVAVFPALVIIGNYAGYLALCGLSGG